VTTATSATEKRLSTIDFAPHAAINAAIIIVFSRTNG
jgi:hypothetical protein